MRVDKAYCIEALRVVDIFEARDVYFDQASPRRRLTFECADDACRQALHPTVTGAMYDRDVRDENDTRRMYFKWGPKSQHLSDCFWLEQRDAQLIVQETRAQGRASLASTNRQLTFSDIEAGDVPDLLYVDSDSQYADEATTRRRHEEIRRNPDRPARIRAYVAQLLDQPNRARGLEQVVEAFEAMSVEERHRARLRISGIGAFSYADVFRRAERPILDETRIFYGGASLESTAAGYRLVFYGEPSIDEAASKVTWFVSHRALESDPRAGFLSSQLTKLARGEARYVKLYVLGKLRMSDHMRGKHRVVDVAPHALKLVVARLISKPRQ